MIEIFTDGACRGNPGPGGWGVLLRDSVGVKRFSGRAEWTTNNRMELTAAIEGLKKLPKNSMASVTTDSQYLRLGVTQWMPNWKRSNWRTSSRQPVKNVDLWQQLDLLLADLKISWHWVKAHSGHYENDIADQLATQAIDHIGVENALCDKSS